MQPPPTTAAGAAYARRAAEFIDRHAGDDIGLTDIAAAAHIGPRGLQAAFRRHHGTTPSAHLRQVRLDRAHDDLVAGDPGAGDTVVAVATRWWFGNAGRFAAAYRHRYGRSPREVLYDNGAADPADTGDAEVVLLDTAGTIVWTNRAWDEFCRRGGGDPGRCGRGSSYLAVCDAAAPDDPASAAVARAIRAASAGEAPAPRSVRLSCGTQEEPAMYDVLVSTRRDDDGQVLGATVVLARQ